LWSEGIINPKLAIYNKRRGFSVQGGSLSAHNMLSHSAAATVVATRQPNLNFFHASYNSQHLVPSVYHFFGPLKAALHG
jgi:hypothetical protein